MNKQENHGKETEARDITVVTITKHNLLRRQKTQTLSL